MLLLFLLVSSVNGAMYMELEDKHYLESHPIKFSSIGIEEMKDIVLDEYDKLSVQCNLPPANIHVIYDESLLGTSVLAWASQNMKLVQGVWKPMLMIDLLHKHFTIAFNPSPPNGWFVGDCNNIRYQYDLRTVIRHEILHGIGMGSSIRFDKKWVAGVFTSGFCFPRLFDTFIVDQNGEHVINGCDVVDISDKKLFIGNVELYHPNEFKDGSSLSHHTYPGHLFYYKSYPNKCMHISTYEAAILEHFQVHCSVNSVQKSTVVPTVLIVLILQTLVLLFL